MDSDRPVAGAPVFRSALSRIASTSPAPSKPMAVRPFMAPAAMAGCAASAFW